MVRGVVEADHWQIFEFYVLDASQLSFARLDYFAEGPLLVVGSNRLFKDGDWNNLENFTFYYNQYEDAIVFP
jgi:hypothetical protein